MILDRRSLLKSPGPLLPFVKAAPRVIRTEGGAGNAKAGYASWRCSRMRQRDRIALTSLSKAITACTK